MNDQDRLFFLVSNEFIRPETRNATYAEKIAKSIETITRLGSYSARITVDKSLSASINEK